MTGFSRCRKMNYNYYQIQFIFRNFGCRDFHPHCKEILKLNSSACDGDFRSSQFMRVACMETCKKCGTKVLEIYYIKNSVDGNFSQK